jgi:cytochrome c-type biogenesis protein CcmF
LWKSATLKLPITAPVLCFALSAFVITTITQEFYRGTRVRQAHTKLDFFTSLIGLVARGKRRYGGYIVHIAIVLMFVGFAGDAYKQEGDFTVSNGKEVTLGRYTLRYDGIEQSSTPEKDMTTATLPVFVGGKLYATMHPAKWFFRHHEDEPPTTEVDMHRTAREDLYVVLNGVDSQLGIANVKVVINPLVDWIWVGFMLLAFGTIIAYMPDRAYVLAGAAAKSDKAKAATTVLVILAMLGGFGSGSGSVARAQTMAPAQAGSLMHTARTPREQKLFEKYKCGCGTCQHSLDQCESECGMGEMRRTEIQGFVDRGMTDEQINDTEINKYGEETLRLPLDKGYRRIVYIAPLAAILGAVGVLVLVARRSSSSSTPKQPPAETLAGAPKEDDDYNARLDDELDELD